ncbi:MAG: aminopeptidase P family protein [Actinobacteria bacterium]|nr:aminopeptidase P family protein [Actinomycetota bacterium]
MSEKATAPAESKRVHDESVQDAYAEFMKTGWAESNLSGMSPAPAVPWCIPRREELSAAFPGIRLVIPAGNFKVRSNDSDYAYRPHSAFAYYTGVQGVEATADSVLIMEPTDSGHLPLLFIHPRSTRDTDAFFRDARYGELWVGRRFTLNEAQMRYEIETRHLDTIPNFLEEKCETLLIRGEDNSLDSQIAKHDREADFLAFASAARLVKDKFEIDEMQAACNSTARGFTDLVRAIPAAVETRRGERVIEAAFFGRARIEGNDIGYSTIAAAGAHACVLHWIRNDGDLRPGELILVDAGVERETYYTADVTRTLPISGKFSPAQRSLYMLVYEAQKAGFAAVKPGADWTSINLAAQKVLAQGLVDMGILTISAEESLRPEIGLHRRWTLHGVSHMLGMDVHDCAQARKDQYTEGTLKVGMVLTVEPGLYIQPDDELFAPEFRGIGIRIEDDVVVTEDGCRILSNSLPRHPDEIERWMGALLD